MARGIADVADLRLEVLQGFITKFQTPPSLQLQTMFPSSISPSATIKWESQTGTRGMSPFKAPGGKTPITSPLGVASHSAEAAFWGEMMYFDEVFLNNIRKEGTESEYLSAQQRLARELARLTTRIMRRKEWMFAQMLTAGSFSYAQTGGIKTSVDYSVPSDHKVTLGTDYKWNTGTSRDIVGDIIDARKKVSDDCGAIADIAICNSTVFKYMAQDSSLQTLLQKSTFGNGDLFSGSKNALIGANPGVVASLLNLSKLIILDELYEVRANLTAVVTGSSTTVVSVDDVTDFVAGDTLTFVDVSAGTTENETIASVQVEDSTVTVSTAPTASFKAGEDYVKVVKPYIPNTKFIMMASSVEGTPTAEYKQAPYGVDRGYGLKVDRNQEFDPEGVYIRVQDKGIPVLYQTDAVYQLSVA